jgi:hypothetical protein
VRPNEVPIRKNLPISFDSNVFWTVGIHFCTSMQGPTERKPLLWARKRTPGSHNLKSELNSRYDFKASFAAFKQAELRNPLEAGRRSRARVGQKLMKHLSTNENLKGHLAAVQLGPRSLHGQSGMESVGGFEVRCVTFRSNGQRASSKTSHGLILGPEHVLQAHHEAAMEGATEVPSGRFWSSIEEIAGKGCRTQESCPHDPHGGSFEPHWKMQSIF